VWGSVEREEKPGERRAVLRREGRRDYTVPLKNKRGEKKHGAPPPPPPLPPRRAEQSSREWSAGVEEPEPTINSGISFPSSHSQRREDRVRAERRGRREGERE